MNQHCSLIMFIIIRLRLVHSQLPLVLFGINFLLTLATTASTLDSLKFIPLLIFLTSAYATRPPVTVQHCQSAVFGSDP